MEKAMAMYKSAEGRIAVVLLRMLDEGKVTED
jgi:hypothetical protein